MDITVIKRNGNKVKYNAKKIKIALENANRDVKEEEDRIDSWTIKQLIADVERIAHQRDDQVISVEEIQDIVEKFLVDQGMYPLAKCYIIYRYEHANAREIQDLDNKILKILAGKDTYSNEENSNKNTFICSTQRDYAAGEISKDLTFRMLLPRDVVKAHQEGAIHFHDADYFMQQMFNCCLINMKDILNNGTCINGKLIEPPKSFRVACTVMTQVIATVASNQYGGQSVDVSCLGPFIEVSRQKHRARIYDEIKNSSIFAGVAQDVIDEYVADTAEKRLKYEISDGVQTMQYQINTLMTTNGQSPFVTLFLNIDDVNNECSKYDIALIIEEIIRQRIEGIKNEKGVYVTPAFPKLVYVLDEHNCLKGGEFDYLTELAVKCSAKRMYPDYISAKKMREMYEGNVFAPMGCRSFLSPWKDENGEYQFYGRFNQGVVSINLPQIAILANGDEDAFWDLLEDRLLLCKKALMIRHKRLEGTLSNVSPLHWQYGAIARMKRNEKIDKLLHGGYSTLSLGYIGFYEMTKVMKGVSHTDPVGKEFAMRVMQRLRDAVDSWKKSTGLGFALYGTPAESLCYRFADIDKKHFGSIQDITDKGYYTNSYHVDVREKIDAFEKLAFESEFQTLSSGGCISYVEIPNLENNLEAIRSLVKFIYETILYAEFNTRSDYCQRCGFHGEMLIDENNQWYCPNCGNRDKATMNVARRTCGYLGENFWNLGKTKEMKNRVLHL